MDPHKEDLLLLKQSFRDVSKELRKNSRSVKNRLHSILLDSQWVKQVYQSYGSRPLIPNERCGLWYVEPSFITETAYFKSTDGHTTQWSFSTRRLNFHLLDIMIENNGLIIVDSTRRGKTMPDALSKTIPIWCAVLNYVMYGSGHESNWFFAPLNIISKSEASSIIKLIPEFSQNLMDLKLVSRTELNDKFKGKYIRPMWVYPGMSLPEESPTFQDFIPVINCVASFRADDGTKQMNGFTYVQGAADDHELWAEKLNPQLFWENVDLLKDLSLGDEALLNIIDTLQIKNLQNHSLEGVVQLTGDLSIGKVINNIKLDDIKNYDTVILFSPNFKFTIKDTKQSLIHYPFSCGKKGSNELRKNITQISQQINKNGHLLALCETGTDLSTGIALLTLCTKYNLQWEPVQTQPLVTKDVIKRHLASILQHKKVNPSRATLQAINSFLM